MQTLYALHILQRVSLNLAEKRVQQISDYLRNWVVQKPRISEFAKWPKNFIKQRENAFVKLLFTVGANTYNYDLINSRFLHSKFFGLLFIKKSVNGF